MIELDKIYNMDCLEGMKQIPDGSVDAVICDLPYGVLNNNNPDAKWDCMIPFEPLWEQYLRVCKQNAPIILFGQGMFTAKLMMSKPDLWRYNLIWKKGERISGFLDAKIKPLRNHEDIVVFYRSLPIYNPQMTWGAKSHPRGGGNHSHTQRCYGKFEDTPLSEPTHWKYPKSVVDFDRDFKKILHPTQKPVKLIEYLVLTYTNVGGVVLDNCMGSGTTAIACHRTKRHFIGFELNKEYFDKAQKRLWEERRQLTLDFE